MTKRKYRDMKRVTVTIEQASDGYFWCRTEEEVYGAGLNAVGKTIEKAKEDLAECMEEARKDYEERGEKPYPVEFVYQYDLRSFFAYFSFLNVSEIARRAGINPSLMRQYVSGVKNAGEKTYSRLAECIDKIRKELRIAHLG